MARPVVGDLPGPRFLVVVVLVFSVALVTSFLAEIEPSRSVPGALADKSETARISPDVSIESPMDNGRAAPPRLSSTAVFASVSAGSVARTIFPGYNASLWGSFTASVSSWDVGNPTYVQSTDTLWFPQHTVVVPGYPFSKFSPVAVFNLSRESFEGFEANITNSTALAYDSANDRVYATQPATDTVLAVNPHTGAVVGNPIPVGLDPVALAFVPDPDSIYVANQLSSNVTIISGSDDQVSYAGIPVGSSPLSIVYDHVDQLVYVANGGSENVTPINADAPQTKPSVPAVNLVFGEPSALAYSSRTDNVIVTVPTSPYATIFKASNGGIYTSVEPVGEGVAAAATSANGTEFVLGNGTGADVTLVNASGTTPTVQTILGSLNLTQIIVDPIHGTVFCWAASSRVLESINLTSGVVIGKTLTTSPEFVSLNGLSDQGWMYAASSNVPAIYTLSASANGSQPAAEIVTPSSPLSLALDSRSDRLFIGTTTGLEVYNATSQQLVQTVAGLSGRCSELVLDQPDHVLWLDNSIDGAVVFDFSTNSLIMTGQTVWSNSTDGIAVDPSDSLAFILTSSSAAEVLNAQTGTVVASSVPVGTNVTSLAFDSADNQIYAAGDQVLTVNASTLESDGSPIQLGPSHKVLGEIYEPSREDVYIATVGLLPGKEGSVIVLDGTSISASEGSLVDIAVGESPDAFGLMPATGRMVPGSAVVWVSNQLSGMISVISSPPQITSFTASPATMDLGTPTSLDVAYEGGAGNSSISYAGLPPGCVALDSPQLNCTPTESGAFAVTVTVTDSFGFSTNSTTTLTVERSLTTLVSCSLPTFPLLDVGILLRCESQATYGLAPYTYQWSFGDGSTASGEFGNHSYADPGVFVLNVEARDSTGATANGSVAVTVVSRPLVAVAARPDNVTDVDVPLSLNATISGGTAASVESWAFGDSTESSGANVTHAWTRPGNFTVTFYYTDALGVAAEQNASIRVNPSVAATFTTGTGSSSGPASPGGEVPFMAKVSGGTPPYDVRWSFGDGSYSTGLSVNHSYAATGTYAIHVELTDSVGASVAANLSVTVATPSSSSGALSPLSSGFGAGLLLGLVVGGVLAAVVLFAVGLRRGGKGSRPPQPPPSPYVPP